MFYRENIFLPGDSKMDENSDSQGLSPALEKNMAERLFQK